MINMRTLGCGVALVLALLVSKPAPADEACQTTLKTIATATATLTQLQKQRGDISAYQASIKTGSSDSGPATCKCDACGMTMPNHVTDSTPRAVKIGGHTFYCCAGCDMSKQVDK